MIELIRRPDYGANRPSQENQQAAADTGRSKLGGTASTRSHPAGSPSADRERHVWYEANAPSTGVGRGFGPTGSTTALGKARDSRGLLSTLFVCGICGGPMHAEGRNEGGYRCARAKNYECWNRTTCLREQAHEAVVAAVAREVMAIADCREQLVARVLEMHASGGDLAASQRALQSEESKLSGSIANLCLAIEKSGDGIEALVRAIASRSATSRWSSRLAELASPDAGPKAPPTAADILRHLESLQAGLVARDTRAGVILRQLLVGPIRAMPHRQFDSNKVVLRAEFEIMLSQSLPVTVAKSIEGAADAALSDLRLVRQPIVVDLFTPSALAAHAVEAHELAETGLSLAKVGEALGMSKRQAHLCSQLGAKMTAAGVTDPYVRLTERPEQVSRWRRVRDPGDGDKDQRRAS